jgi:hypothetical protein
VIWDRTPATLLARQSLPRALIDLHLAEYFAVNPADSALTVTDRTRSTYWGPARATQLRRVLTLPSRGCAELQADDPAADTALVEWLDDDDFEASYQAAFDGHAPPRQQLLGLPVPLQDDPRYNAVALSDFGEQYLSREIWDGNRPRIYQAVGEWRLLLQVDLADYLQEHLAEGTVYFLITQDALAARAFEQVVAVYQQT